MLVPGSSVRNASTSAGTDVVCPTCRAVAGHLDHGWRVALRKAGTERTESRSYTCPNGHAFSVPVAPEAAR